MKFTDEQKKAIVARYENGGSIRLTLLRVQYSAQHTLSLVQKPYKVDIIANGIPFTAKRNQSNAKSNCEADQYNHNP